MRHSASMAVDFQFCDLQAVAMAMAADASHTAKSAVVKRALNQAGATVCVFEGRAVVCTVCIVVLLLHSCRNTVNTHTHIHAHTCTHRHKQSHIRTHAHIVVSSSGVLWMFGGTWACGGTQQRMPLWSSTVFAPFALGVLPVQVGEDMAPLFMKLLLCGIDKRVYNCQVRVRSC